EFIVRGWKTPILAAMLMTISFITYLIISPENPISTNVTPDRAPPVLERVKPTRDVTPDEILKAPQLEETVLERLPAVEPPPLPPKPIEPDRFQRPEIIAAGIIKSGGRLIELAGIDPVQLEQTCETQSGGQWPCGRFARTELRSFIRGRPIECDPVDENTGTIVTRCRLASSDISAWLVMTGWARPKGNLFAEELAAAKENERGIWRKTAP
ncbi:MAG: thermonuclease family protein, partial [Pseudomonadota bacterium]